MIHGGGMAEHARPIAVIILVEDVSPSRRLDRAAAIHHGATCATRRHAMPSAFAKPENVLALAGIALADLAVLVSAQQYVPTLHLSKTSFWSGTRINQMRFGSYPDAGLIELARAEASARAGTWDTWAFACVAVSPIDRSKPVLLVDAGGAPLGNTVRIIWEFRPPNQGFGLVGR